ncbi:50S ribosomal protein L6, partial [Vogesella mureinivorans]|uniref:50S ribosomal protein L6 n=1 Tax=Vogesella mureinivorans TaxID=657276 RepID=UPI0011CBE54A
MSRIGKQPVAPVSGVTVTVDGQKVTAKGSKGELSVVLVDAVKPELTDDGVVIAPTNDSREARAAWGMSRT